MNEINLTKLNAAFATEARDVLQQLVHRYRAIPAPHVVAVLGHMAGYIIAQMPAAGQSILRETAIQNIDNATLAYLPKPEIVFAQPMAKPTLKAV